MGKPTGFMEFKRREAGRREVADRTADFLEVDIPLTDEQMASQAARCMDCGVPFCHGVGCPLGNRIPEFNDLVYTGRWREACQVLHATNNFPEITGRICPAPCEAACTLRINDEPVLIRHIEYQIVERGFKEGWIVPQPPAAVTGRRVAVVGSGPAGLAAAQQLVRAGHEVTVFEKNRRPGGLLRYGIPDFKLPKWVLDRRIEQMKAEGVKFETGVAVGEDLSARYLRRTFDATCLTVGAGVPRDLTVQGRGLENVHFAMDFLGEQNRINAGELSQSRRAINARDAIVAVIGGGDTGSDCVGTAIRQGAREVHQLEILPMPPVGSNPVTPWPTWPVIFRTSSSQEEGCRRHWSVLTTRLSGTGVRVSHLHGVKVQWEKTAEGMKFHEVVGSEFQMPVDLVLVAMGFVHAEHAGLVDSLRLAKDGRGNVAVDANGMTSVEGVFAAGDAASGASLVVRAIAAGRKADEAINAWLTQNRGS